MPFCINLLWVKTCALFPFISLRGVTLFVAKCQLSLNHDWTCVFVAFLSTGAILALVLIRLSLPQGNLKVFPLSFFVKIMRKENCASILCNRKPEVRLLDLQSQGLGFESYQAKHFFFFFFIPGIMVYLQH